MRQSQINLNQQILSIETQSIYEKNRNKLLILEFGKVLSKTSKPNVRQHFIQLRKQKINDKVSMLVKIPHSLQNLFCIDSQSLLNNLNELWCAIPQTNLNPQEKVVVYNPYATISSILIHMVQKLSHYFSLIHLSPSTNQKPISIPILNKSEFELTMFIAQFNGWITSAHELMSSPLMTELINKHLRKLKDRENQINKLLDKPRKNSRYDVAHYQIFTNPFANDSAELLRVMKEINPLIKKILSDLKNKFTEKTNKALNVKLDYVWNISFQYQDQDNIYLIWNIYLLDEVSSDSSINTNTNQTNDISSANKGESNLHRFVKFHCFNCLQNWQSTVVKMGIQVNIGNEFNTIEINPFLNDLMTFLTGDSVHSINTKNGELIKQKYFSCGHL